MYSDPNPTASSSEDSANKQPGSAHGSPAFDPSPGVTMVLIDELCDCGLSLQDMAKRHGITLTALCDWMNKPETVERLYCIESYQARKVREIAAAAMPLVHAALKKLAAESDDGPRDAGC